MKKKFELEMLKIHLVNESLDSLQLQFPKGKALDSESENVDLHP